MRCTTVSILAILYLAGLHGGARGEGIHLSMVPSAEQVPFGDTIVVSLTIFQGDDPFNAFDINLGFDPSRFAYVPTSPSFDQIGPLMRDACPNLPFHRFTVEPDQLRITVSLLCADVDVTGPGVVYWVKFRALQVPGEARFVCREGTKFYHAGIRVSPLECVDGVVGVYNPGSVPGTPGETDGRLRLAPPRPNPRVGAGASQISFFLPEEDAVVLRLLDARGRVVGRTPTGRWGSGWWSLPWDATGIPSGVYYLTISTAGGREARTTWLVLH